MRALAINADFSWDFERGRGDDKLRLVVRCSEKSLRDLCEVLAPVATISKRGYHQGQMLLAVVKTDGFAQ